MARRPVLRAKLWPDVPAPVVKLAEERTGFLMEYHVVTTRTIKGLLANAYLQGMADCAEVSAGMMLRREQEALASIKEAE